MFRERKHLFADGDVIDEIDADLDVELSDTGAELEPRRIILRLRRERRKAPVIAARAAAGFATL